MEPDASNPPSQPPCRERDLLERVFETSPVGIVVADAAGRISFCNAAGAHIIGMPREAITTLRHDSPILRIADEAGGLLPDEGLPFNKVRAQQAAVYAQRVTLARPDGRRVLLSVNAAPLLRSDGAFDGIVAAVEDITERVTAERALAESEERYRRITAAVTDYVYSVRIQLGRAIETRHGVGCAPVTGYTTEDFARDPSLWYDMIVPEDRPRVETFLQQVTAGIAPPPIEHRIVRKDGEMRWVRNTPVLHVDADGALVAFDGLVRDITERRQAEEALRESEAQLASIVRVAPIGIGLVVDRVIRRVNDRVCEMTGYSRDELLGQSSRMVYPTDEEFERVGRDEHRKVAEHGTGSGETRWRCKDGHVIDVLLGLTAMDAADPRLGVTFTALDITERKRAEEALRASEERLRLAVEAADVCYWDLDARSRQMTYGGCHEAIFGRRLPASAKESAEFFAIVHPDDRPVLRALSDGLRAGAPGSAFELRVLQPDGSPRWVACRCQAHRDASGTLTRLVGVAQDVTQRRRAEDERRQFEARQQQQQRLESLGTLAAGVAHEINNPLTGIMNYAQLIVNKLDDGAPSRRHAQRIVDESERVSEIVRNLLAFARQDSRAPAATRLADVVGRTLALVRALIRKDQILLTTEVPEDLPMLTCRPQQLQQVLLNLLTNACDALNERFPSGHPDKVLRLSAQVLSEDGRRWLRTTVEDAGVGVPSEIATRIFEPFFTTKPRDVGTGLGLSISYGIVKAEHGRLLLENPAGGPTRFHVDLPLDGPQADRQPALAPSREG